MEYLFCYGTLRDPDVRESLFGRRVRAHADELGGYAQTPIRISDAAFAETSGSATHHILRPVADASSRVAGTALELSEEELRRVDRYEPVEYRRVPVRLVSGRCAWVYIDAAFAGSGQ